MNNYQLLINDYPLYNGEWRIDNGKKEVKNCQLSIKNYPLYKDSAIDWIGEIPEHWKVQRVKELATLVLGKMLDHESAPKKFYHYYLKSKNITWFKVDISSVDQMYFTPHEMKAYRLKVDNLLLSEGGEVGKTSIWREELNECYIQNSVHKVTVFKSQHPQYHLYQSVLLGQLKYYDSIVNQVSIKHLTKEKLSRVFWLCPPLKEQKAIADYLDTKTAQIDRKIDLLTQKVQRYEELKRAIVNETVTRGLDKSVPMKDSGIEWIGEIPEHWNVLPLKDLASKKANSFVDGPFGSDLKSHEHTEYGIPLIQLNNIGIGTHYIQNLRFISEQKASFLSRHKAYPGELAIAKMAEPVARAAVIRDDYPLYVIVADCIKLKPNPNIALSHFLGYALNSIGVKSQAEVLSNGTTRIRIGLSTAKLLKVALPTLSEQQEIAEYLDRKTEQIEQIIENINFQIEKLKELRKTLINDVVTGKIKVIDN